MQQKVRQLKIRREFSEEFKVTRVREFESGRFTVRELGKLYQIQEKVITRWIHRYSLLPQQKVRIVEIEDSSTQRLKQLEDRIKDLERIVGQKQIMIDLLESLIAEAKEAYGLDIKKNCSTQPSGASGSEGPKGVTP